MSAFRRLFRPVPRLHGQLIDIVSAEAAGRPHGMLGLSLVLCLLAASGVQPRDPLRETLPSLQDLDMDRLMEDDQLFKEYYQCLVDSGPCNRDSKNFREMIQEAMSRGCARCSDTQRREAIQLLRLVMECRPREYDQIERQFDPTGAFRDKYKFKRAALV